MTTTPEAIVYVGPSDSVDAPDAGIVGVRDVPVKVGDGPGEVNAKEAWRLLEQRGTWAKATLEKPATGKDGK